MGQASSFVLHVVEDAIQRYLKEQKELRKESFPLEEGYGEEKGRFHSACSFQQSSIGSFLTVEELRVILTFLPECLSSIDLHHLALLFVLDSDHDGLFSVSDLKQFVVWALAAIPVETPLDDLADVLRGRAVLRCWYVCHMEPQKPHGYINRIPVLNGNEGSDDHDSLEYFGCWVLKLLYSVDANKTSYASFNPPPLPDAPNENESVVMLHSGLCGVSDGKAAIARVVSSRNGRCAAGGKYSGRSSYRDAYEKPSQLLPELNINTIPLTSPRERPRIYWNKEGKQGGGEGKESIEGNLHSCVFGAKALKELYRDLSVEKLYGLSFLGLCQMLSAQDKVDIDIGDDGDASPVEREEATAIRKMNVGASFNQSLYVSNTQVEPLTSCCISGKTLKEFLMCFCKAYWSSLRRLGLQPLDGALAER